MTSVDKAAIGWSMGIVAVAIGIALAGTSFDSGSSSQSATPTMTSSSDQKIQAAKEQIEKQQMSSQEEQRAQAIESQLGGSPSVQPEESVTVSEPKIEDVPVAMGPMTVDVNVPTGTAVPGCEETNECFLPSDVSINTGDTVILD